MGNDKKSRVSQYHKKLARSMNMSEEEYKAHRAKKDKEVFEMTKMFTRGVLGAIGGIIQAVDSDGKEAKVELSKEGQRQYELYKLSDAIGLLLNHLNRESEGDLPIIDIVNLVNEWRLIKPYGQFELKTDWSLVFVPND